MRPSLRFNLLVLALGLAILAAARMHRRELDARFARMEDAQKRSPRLVAEIRIDLAEMELTRESLDQELLSRMAMVRSFQAEQFYLAIDTANRRMRLHFGPEIVREAPVVIGEARTVKAGGKTWNFVPLKGALTVRETLVDPPWEVPPWAHAMRDVAPPSQPLTVPGGLGRYVVLLPHGYVIHSPPPPASPLQGAKPGSFLVAEDQMRAIWPRISAGTRVYVY